MKATPEISSRLDGATLALATGNLPKAESICTQILDADPDVAQAHVLLGIVAQRTGRSPDAIRHLTRAHELQPTLYDAAACLTTAYRLSGDESNAIRFAQVAVRLKPNDPLAQMELGSLCLGAMRLREAEEHLRQAVTLSGGSLHMQLALSQCLDREGKREEALKVVREALQAYSLSVEELLNFTALMLSQGNPTGAVEAGREAVRRAPKVLRAQAQLARSLVEAGEGDKALTVLDDPSLAEFLLADDSDSEWLTVVGMAFQSVGRIKEARHWLRRAIQVANPVSMAFYAYTHAGRMTEEDRETIHTMETRLAAPSQVVDSTSMRFALGKAYEDLGDYERAMEQYEAANRSQAKEQAPFDRNFVGGTDDPMISLFTKEFLAANGGHGSPSELPIFIVGMIRSGTTLAEQVLSSHPSIGGAGEVSFWTYNAADVLDAENGVLDKIRLREVADRYLARLSSSHPGKLRVVDKMPSNFKYLGLLHLALPNARVIHMRRNAVDTCLSIYSTHSRALNEAGYDKGDLVHTRGQYQRVMAHWRALLPADRFLEVDYEDLVTKSEPTIRRMIEFCGLEWDDACLQPEANPRVVSTPSLWQVRRPINTSSVERWRRFEPWLGEFRELLPPT